MNGERYVLLGLAPVRAEWFRTVGQWATSAMAPVEFIRCLSVEELRTRLRSGRAFSAAIVDGALPGVDRDLLARAAEAGVAVLVVDGDHRREWRSLGAAAVLSAPFSRDELLEVLGGAARPVGSATVGDVLPSAPAATDHLGDLIAVAGPGGTGASTVAISLAQGLAEGHASAARPRRSRASIVAPTVLLADLCRAADQAMLHDVKVVVPGVQELVEAHRTGVPPRSAFEELTFDVPDRGYRLLLGLRRPRHWVSLRPHAFDAALTSLLRQTDIVVADVEPDVEGLEQSGSADVQDRNVMARCVMSQAAAVVVVGGASMQGVHALVRTVGEVVEHGVAPDRVLTVINRAPKRPRARAEITASLADLLGASIRGASALVSPVFLPQRPVEAALRDGVALPAPLPGTVARAVVAVLRRAASPTAQPVAAVPEPVVPGSLAPFTQQEDPNP